MPGILCPHCLQPLTLPLLDICPACGKSLENANPEGALPYATLLADRYTIGDYLTSDGDGLCYQGVENASRRFVRIKEFFPVTLCNGRSRDGALLPKEGREVLFKTNLMDFRDLYEDLRGLTAGTEGLSRILDVVEENNTLYAIEEGYKGMTLTHYLSLRSRPMPPNEACELLRPVMDGVAAMHKAGLVHRGICPDNILLPIDGAARLSGYGTLALRTAGSELKSQIYAGYAAPEQYSAAEFSGSYTDVYALAAVIYRLVTGQAPPPVGQRQQRDSLESAHSLESGVPAYFAQVLACALRLDTAKRMQTVPELAGALADPSVASAMFERGDSAAGTRKILAASLAAVLVLTALLLWGLLRTPEQAGPAPAVSEPPPASEPDAGSVDEATPAPTDAVNSAAPAEQPVLIPNLVGKRYQSEIANNDELLASYRIVVTESYSSSVAQGVVISQDPVAGTMRQDDQVLNLEVSLGPELATMPDIYGFAVADAEQALQEAGIRYTLATVANDGQYAAGQVVECSVVAGTRFNADEVTVTVSVADERSEPTPEPTPDPQNEIDVG